MRTPQSGTSSSVATRTEAAEITVRAATDGAAWDAYVIRHPEASAYHRFGWRDVMARAFGHESRYL